jgi:hydroxyacylglutathione hydrolase
MSPYRLLADDGPTAVLSGGALLAGGIPRQDLEGARWTALLAREQHRTVHRLVATTPVSALVLPSHGFARFGKHRGAPADPLPLAEQGRITRALQLSEDKYVADAVQAASMRHASDTSLAAVNAAGPPPMDLRPQSRLPLDPAAVRRRLRRGEWVIDVRPRHVFADAHLKGSINVEVRGALASVVAWLVPGNRRLTLVGDDEQQLTTAYRDVGGVGMDRVEVAFLDPEELRARDVAKVRRVDAAALAGWRPGALIDVRLPSEWQAWHLPGVVSIPLSELALRPRLPDGELWVYSATGFRAAVAASLLAAWGREAVLIDGELPLENQNPL